MKYTDTPCGRCIEAAEKDLGPLTEGQKVDLLLDNFMQIANVEEAKEILKAVTVNA